MMSDEQKSERDSAQPKIFHIRTQGHLSQQWTDWFGGLSITLEEDGNTLLSGTVVDQSALHGILKKVCHLGMPLLSVNSVDANQATKTDSDQVKGDNMTLNPFLNSERQLRNGWWILIFFLVLAAFLMPMIMIAQENNGAVSMGRQALIILLASLISQLARRRPLAELFGTLDVGWVKELCVGGLIGSVMMLVPALLLGIFGWVRWQWNPVALPTLSSSLLLFAGVAAAEELLFRGFVFQRLISGLGQWPAQLITAAFFLLTHLNNPGMTGTVKVMASINIFLASILFGVAFIRTRSLAMPLGLHWMANWMQGGVLGFGVSGTEHLALIEPVFQEAPAWLTGGQFGLEASLPGLVSLLAILIIFYRWKNIHRKYGFKSAVSGTEDA